MVEESVEGERTQKTNYKQFVEVWMVCRKVCRKVYRFQRTEEILVLVVVE